MGDPASPARYGVEGPGLEGYLFPETYQLAKGLAAEEVVGALVAQFRARLDRLRGGLRARGLWMRQAVTLASLVEKETGAPHERPLIAGVFLNRLRLGMRLETDPSVIYGIAGFDGNLTRAHLEDESNPYNTYRIAALPPGPIANPGAEALRAVAQPAATDSLYFVSRNDGTHAFSKSYAEHVGNVRRYQLRGEVGDGGSAPPDPKATSPSTCPRSSSARCARRSAPSRRRSACSRACAASTRRSWSRCTARAAAASC